MARHKREDWPSLLAQWEAGGESPAEFASRMGVHPRTLGRWKRALEKGVDRLERARTPRIVEVRSVGLPADHRFEVRLAGGRSVGVPPSFDGEALGRLLRVLEGGP
jgi:hypothetical protein